MSNVIKANIPFTVNGTEYLLGMLTLSDFMELERFLQGVPIRIAREHGAGMDTEDRAVLLKEAMNRAMDIKIGTPEFNKEAQGTDGLKRIFWMSLKKNHPKMSEKESVELISALEPGQLTQLAMEAAGWVDDEDEQSPDPTRTTESQSTSHRSTED